MSARNLIAGALGALVTAGCADVSTEVTWTAALAPGETRGLVGVYTVGDPADPPIEDRGDTLYASAYVQSEPAGAWLYADVEDDSCGSIVLTESLSIPFPGGPPHVQVADDRLELGPIETMAGPRYFAESVAPAPGSSVAFPAAEIELSWPERLVLTTPERLFEPSEPGGRVLLEWEPPSDRARRRGPQSRIHIDGAYGQTFISCRLRDDGEALLPAEFAMAAVDFLAVGRIVDARVDLDGVPFAFIATRMIEVPIP